MAKEKILKFPSEDLNNYARRAFQPKKSDLKAIAKEAKRDAKRGLGKYKKGHTDDEEEEEEAEEAEEDSDGVSGPKTKKTKKLTAEEVNQNNYYSSQGKFPFKPAELKKILPQEEVSNAHDAIEYIDPTVLMLMERVVQLSLGRAAGL
jgi:hypothetical protein